MSEEGLGFKVFERYGIYNILFLKIHHVQFPKVTLWSIVMENTCR